MINSKKTLVGLDACFRFGTDGKGHVKEAVLVEQIYPSFPAVG